MNTEKISNEKTFFILGLICAIFGLYISSAVMFFFGALFWYITKIRGKKESEDI